VSIIILPPKKRILRIEEPLDFKFRVRGLYRCEVRGPDGRLRKDTGWFSNLITNQGLDFLYQQRTPPAQCAVGTGNSTPANTDTQLNAQIAATSVASTAIGNGGTTPNFYGFTTYTYQFGQGAAAGNLQEIGVGLPATPVSLFSRALILNGSGSPTTLTILADEFLTVTYQLQLYNPTSDVTGSVTVSGTVCNFTLRAANANSSSWYGDQMGMDTMTLYSDTSLQPITGALVGTQQGGANSITYGSYSPGQYYIDSNAQWPLTSANGGANNSAMCTFGQATQRAGACQIIFGATIPKNNTQLLNLTMRQSWGRGT
jgi:hypothetical protein